MYNLIKTFRLAIIIIFLLSVIFLFAKYLLLPILIFVIAMKVFGRFKFKKTASSNTSKKRQNTKDNNVIDVEYEDVE
jgi:hypothetical protein